MKWEKKGLIFKPSGEYDWSKTHAQVPVADFIEAENIVRVYYSTRDKLGRSLPGMVELDADNLLDVRRISEKPLLNLGKIGEFDDSGVMPSWILNKGQEKWMYYIGWNVRNTIPYHNSVGLALSRDGGKTFTKFSNGPLWDRNYLEPHYSGTSCVILDQGIYKNWYLSCTEWREVKGRVEPRYNIKYAESADGINWKRNGVIAIDYINDEEAGIVKASVVKEGPIYRMWYSYRKFTDYRIDPRFSYRIGYAESFDGISWKRLDNSDLSLDVSESGEAWDGMMVEYPHVISIKGVWTMFYNGNGFGQSGLGYAQTPKL